METATLSELRKHMKKYFDAVEAGEWVRVYRHGNPVADIRPVRNPKTPSWKRPGLRLQIDGVSLSEAIIQERRGSKR